MHPPSPKPLASQASDVALILLAAGASTRLEGGTPKPFRRLGGRPVWGWSLEAASRSLALGQIVLVHPSPPPGEANADPVLPCPPPLALTAVPGGSCRAASVRAGLRALAEGIRWVLVHDAARPFAPPALFAAVLEAARQGGASTAALPPVDALRLREPPASGPLYLPREAVVRVQTPQGFRRDLLEAAHRDAPEEAEDDASLVAAAGHPVTLVPGAPGNFKITSSEDWDRALATAGVRAGAGLPRIGQGYDIHRLAAGRPLYLGGLQIPSTRGLVGHSDGDVACHAVADALLGAAGLGDLGEHFPPGAPAWQGVSGARLLGEVAARVAEAGYRIGNVDVTVLAEAPRLAPHRAAMAGALAAALGISADRVSVKATTCEGLGPVGAGAAIAAHAVALLAPDGDGGPGASP